MKIKTILAAVLLGTCIVSMPSDMMAQKKSTGTRKSATAKKSSSGTASKGAVKKSPLTKSDLIGKKYVGWFDTRAQLGNRLYSSLDFKESGLDLDYASREYDCIWNVDNNEVSFTFSNIPVILYSKDNGKTLEGFPSNNKNLPIKYFYLGEEGTYDKQSLKKKLVSGKYTSSLIIKFREGTINIPATFKISVDEEDPEEMSFKVTGDSEMFNYTGALKGDIFFEDNGIEYEGVDGEEYTLEYKDINKNVLIIPLGEKKLVTYDGLADLDVYIYF